MDHPQSTIPATATGKVCCHCQGPAKLNSRAIRCTDRVRKGDIGKGWPVTLQGHFCQKCIDLASRAYATFDLADLKPL